MGLDEGHMGYIPLAQAVPPAYGQLVFAQMCMHECCRQLGVQPITFDQRQASPVESDHLMRSWLRGAGDASGQGAVAFSSPCPTRTGLEPHVEMTPDAVSYTHLTLPTKA